MHIRRAVGVGALSVALVVSQALPSWADTAGIGASAPDDDGTIVFLSWWAAGAILLCSALSAVMVHLNYRAH